MQLMPSGSVSRHSVSVLVVVQGAGVDVVVGVDVVAGVDAVAGGCVAAGDGVVAGIVITVDVL